MLTFLVDMKDQEIIDLALADINSITTSTRWYWGLAHFPSTYPDLISGHRDHQSAPGWYFSNHALTFC